ALFYKWIIVPDSFFHCYGPLFTHLALDARHHKSSLPTADECRRSPVLAFLRAGVVVPAIREGASIHENWHRGQAGVPPGEHLIVSRRDGQRTLRLVDDTAKHDVAWPDPLAPKNSRPRPKV